MNMRTYFLIFLIVLTGCAHGPIGDNYPPKHNTDSPSIVVIQRDSKFKAGGATNIITINDIDSYHLKNGEQISFKVNNGPNIIGVNDRNPWTYTKRPQTIYIDCKPGQFYYLKVDIHLNIASTIRKVDYLVIRDEELRKYQLEYYNQK